MSEKRPIAREVYASFADRYSALAPTKAHNALYERPATMALLGDVEGRRILDAGCGPGISSEIMARRGALVYGFDVTPEMIDHARRRCEGLSVEFMIGDLAEPLDHFEDAFFDKILCALALDYVEELSPVFREFRRVTRPGGLMVFSMSHPMRDWSQDKKSGDAVYYERARFAEHWTGFGEPFPLIESYRRPLSEIFNAVLDGGWTLDRIVEPRPSPDMRIVAERIYRRLAQAPDFICIRARR